MLSSLRHELSFVSTLQLAQEQAYYNIADPQLHLRQLSESIASTDSRHPSMSDAPLAPLPPLPVYRGAVAPYGEVGPSTLPMIPLSAVLRNHNYEPAMESEDDMDARDPVPERVHVSTAHRRPSAATALSLDDLFAPSESISRSMGMNMDGGTSLSETMMDARTRNAMMMLGLADLETQLNNHRNVRIPSRSLSKQFISLTMSRFACRTCTDFKEPRRH